VTYFGVLLRFVGVPIVLLSAIAILDLRRGRALPAAWRTWPPWIVLLGHVAIAVIYTTPWDNYLVANRVWWYDPALVTGITLGWVPIEEYTFFVVQTLMTGLWLLAWMRWLQPPAARFSARPALRWTSLGVAGLVWVPWLALLLAGWTKGLYMALLLVWFLPPIMLQLAFGADILWHHRRLVLVGVLVPFVYLCLVDAIAIYGGTWAINPANTVGLDLGGVLPLEEVTFFLATNVLIVFGMVLALAQESRARAVTGLARVASRLEDRV
jgi:lycopene cyclase domain-containing protein